ncbi:amino acid adenylation domain-containing protein [Streptomyces sp. TRM43335]|uniref:Amino acid adenylation domain-containing protein n=1 Tax=Streptomyces taklimakanensis TaxID=2569853 RepID=A0A6G2BJD7_9ACTN|nr:non-ribosomal peptide synthetase [Streptomyces taklimakanensis]MTE22395.1 amino acid adenylation domain-containing protein [Streptomyces taklimakanensis]
MTPPVPPASPQAPEAAGAPGALRAGRTAPASRLQRGLWFLDRWDPGSATYTTPTVYEFRGPLDLSLLERALAAVVDRHEALRTTFDLHGDVPRQLVHPALSVPLSVTDLRTLPAAERDRRAERVLSEAATEPFDLATGPLLRATAVRRGERETTVQFVVHHIVWDGWSAEIFERELTEGYAARVAGRAPRHPRLTVQYADHAAEEEHTCLEDQLDHWRRRLRGAPTVLELPGRRPRAAEPGRHGATEHFDTAPGTAARVRELAEREGVTPHVVNLAVFALLLHRYTGARDLVVGTPVTTRGHPELEHLIGYFVNLLPLRLRLEPEMTFRRLLVETQDALLDGYGHLDAPLDLIVDRLDLERSPGRSPLVQVVFGSHTEDPAPLRFGPDLTATRQVRSNGTSKFDLTWSVFDSGELRGEAEYRTGLLDAATVRRMIGDWTGLLDAALADSGRALPRLTVAAASAERPRGPAAEAARAPGRCLHTLFEEAVDAHGARPAVTDDAGTLDYAELDRRANRLAHVLIAAGVRPGDRVGLRLDRTAWIPAAVLAVLKAGAAYVPVDPAAPADRSALVFAETGVTVAVTDLPGLPEGPWLSYRLDERAAELAAADPGRPGTITDPRSTAYVIFTSGSTGRPKGVAVAHEHVSRLMAQGDAHFGFGPDEVWTLFHSHAFDWTVWELWGALHHGARLVVVPYLTSRSPEEFAELLERERVSFLCLTPSALRQLEPAVRRRSHALPALRRIMLGGEALDPATVRRWFTLDPLPPARLCNLYGITETTVHVTTHDLAADGAGFDRSLIGTPLPHLDARVLDPWLRPCPPGVTGELYIGGGSLAHGYWGRPGLTAGRFVADPGAAAPGARLYRTGDLARRLPDGGLEYLGRGDRQIKLSGFRIEPGEIEEALSAHPDVFDCVVTVHQGRLAAYVTGRAPENLREFLGRTLPAHMIPAGCTVLDSLPLTPNGKLDHRALPAPRFGSTGPAAPGSGTRTAPRGPVEQTFARAWSEVLGVGDIGVHDDFFRLGGDSIRAVQLAGRLQEHGWSVSLRDVFTAPTIAELVPLASPAAPDAEASAGEPMPFALAPDGVRKEVPPGVEDAYPMVSMQLSMVYHMEIAGGTDSYHNVNSYRLSAALDEDAFRRSVAEAMRRHPVLRTSLDLSGHVEPMQLVHAELPPPVEFADLRGLAPRARDAAVRAVFEHHRDTPFDLERAPLFRITVQRLAEDACQLTICEHHAILDGWSFTSLLAELLERHGELVADPAAPPAAPPASRFRDFVAAERAAAEDPASLAYWRERLAGAHGRLWPGSEDVHELPRTLERVLPEAPGQLRAAARAAGVPVKSVALAAHLRALAHLTGRRHPVTGLAMNGRLEREGGADAYGLFLNTVPLRAELPPPGTDGLEPARTLHREELDMMPHRRVPFARLARLMADGGLDSQFGYLRFHALGRLGSARIVDGRIGCEPTLRHEPNSFAFGASLIQDPVSGRALLAVDHQRSVVPDAAAESFLDAYAEALHEMATAARTTAPAHP